MLSYDIMPQLYGPVYMQYKDNSDYVDFGFKSVKTSLKTGLVNELFSKVSNQYDVMNDVMSLGLHRCWKKIFVDKLSLKPNMKILDLAGGTGDIAIRIASKKAYLNPSVTVCDLTYEMMKQGKRKAINRGIITINWHGGNAEKLTYKDKTFDVVTIAFGLRNITNKNQALKEIARILKPGGRLFCLEFMPPEGFLKAAYDFYSFNLIPWFGEHIAKDREAYQYLVESIRQFPEPDILKSMCLEQGFSKCAYEKWTGNIVALHQAVVN